MRILRLLSIAATLAALIPGAAFAQAKRPVLAVFAHPDDERVIGPLLSKLAREGRETHLVIATDGSKGDRLCAHSRWSGARRRTHQGSNLRCQQTRRT